MYLETSLLDTILIKQYFYASMILLNPYLILGVVKDEIPYKAEE